MTDIIKLADDYANEPIDMYALDPRKYRDMYRADLQSAIEALQAEVAEHKENAMRNARQAVAFRAERDALQAKLDAMGKGEQAAFEYWLESVHPSGDATEVKQKWEASAAFRDWHNAAPKALAPLTDGEKHAMWIAATIELPSQENCYLRGIADAERHHGITKGTP